MSREAILVVDDDKLLLKAVAETLSREGLAVTTAGGWEEAEMAARQKPFDLFILDFKMPEKDGIELMKQLRRITPAAEAMIITGYGSIEKGVEAIRAGARDYVAKPIKGLELLHRVSTILERRQLHRSLQQKEVELKAVHGFDAILGASQAMADVRELAQRAATVQSTVLIEGERGTGKEMLARAIHHASARASGPFVSVSCTVLTPDTAASELFGSAAADADGGRFVDAQGGSLFLDEIEALPAELQLKLHHVLESQTLTAAGGSKPMPMDVRLLCATRVDLEASVKRGDFRDDLYYRVRVIPIAVPPLRERREDIATLTAAFIGEGCERAGVPAKTIAEDAMMALEEYSWPGNVRELQTVLERSVALATHNEVGLTDLPEWILQEQDAAVNEAAAGTGDFMALRRQAQERFDRAFLEQALRAHGGNISQTAKSIGLVRSALQRFIRKYKIDREEF